MKLSTLSLALILSSWLISSALAQSKTETGSQTQLKTPQQTSSSIRFSTVIGWPKGISPKAPPGFQVSIFAEDFQSPRQIYQAANGDIFVAEANTELKPSGFKKLVMDLVGYTRAQRTGTCACRITLFRDLDGDSFPEQRQVVLENLKQPYGMLMLADYFYVAATDGLWRYPLDSQKIPIQAQGQKIVDLPAGGYNNHWTRNLTASPDGQKIYISVGSGSNIAEHGLENEQRRANILEINPDGSAERVFGSGLRNPVGMSWSSTGQLWTVVNERDGLGDELVPDYLTRVVANDFFGWPFSYFGENLDPRVSPQNPEKVKLSKKPDYALGSHTASLGLSFYHHHTFPEVYRGGAFIGQHGSWNRSQLVGYQVAFVPFQAGEPAGPLQPFLTGFIADAERNQVYGRPVGVLQTQAGSLLVADDAGNKIWRVRALPFQD